MIGRLNCVSCAAGSTRARLLYKFLVCSICHMPHTTCHGYHTHTHTHRADVCSCFWQLTKSAAGCDVDAHHSSASPIRQGVGARGLRAELPPLKKGTHTHSFLLPASHSTFLNIFNCCASFHAWVGQKGGRSRSRGEGGDGGGSRGTLGEWR